MAHLSDRFDKIVNLIEAKIQYLKKHDSPYEEEFLITCGVIDALKCVKDAIKESGENT